jgi:hypothetical protein
MLNTFKYLFFPFLFLLTLLHGASLTEADLRQAAANWMSSSAIFQQQSPVAEVDRIERIFSTGQEALPVYVLHLNPAGYLVLTGDDTLPPVLAFSAKAQAGNVPRRRTNPFLALLRLQGERYRKLLAEPQTRSDEYRQRNLECWQRLLAGAVRAEPLENPSKIIRDPLIEQPWDQHRPYNLYLPRSTEEISALTGCEPTAAALIMNFHQWPPRGKGSKTWTSVVDTDFPPEYSATGTVSADFSIPYDWELMQNSYPVLQSPPTASELAVARLIFDLGVAFESQFGTFEIGTATYTDKPIPALETYFGYSGLIQEESRSQATLFQHIKEDVLAGYPVRASTPDQEYEPGHAFVVSGLAQEGGADYYFLNYGWGGHHSGWYRLNDGYDVGDKGTVIDSAITHFLPAKQAMFREIPFEQPRNFKLHWDFPHIHTAKLDCFRLSVNTTVISDQIPGDAREYQLFDQPLGDAEYFLEAKVGGVWQAKSDALLVKIVDVPAPVPEFVLDQEIVVVQPDRTASVALQLHHQEDELSVFCSRPDLYPADQIRISGEGIQREIRLIPTDNITGNAMLHVTAQNARGMKYTRTVSIIWDGLAWMENLEQAEYQAAEQHKKIFLVIGMDNDSYTAELKYVFCEISDIRNKLQNEYVCCYLEFPEQVNELFGGGMHALPLTAILQYDRWSVIFRNDPIKNGFLSPDVLRNVLAVEPLQVSPAEQEVNYQEQSVFVRVITKGNWMIGSDSAFLIPKRSSGSGNATVECLLQENDSDQERVAQLTVSSAGVNRICQIRQHRGLQIEVAFAVAAKEYDGTVGAVFAGDPEVTGIAQGHDVQVDFSSARLEFSDAEPGVDKEVRLYGTVLTGNDADLYQLPTEITSLGTIRPNNISISIPPGWNAITLLLDPDEESMTQWTAKLLVFEYQNRCFVRTGVPQAGKTYVIYNKTGEELELELTGKKWLEGQGALPSTPGWVLQSITEATELPAGMSAWLLLNGKYLRITDGLEAGKAYWLHP